MLVGGVGAKLRLELFTLFIKDVGDYRLAAFGDKPSYGGGADAARAASDDTDLAVEPAVCRCVVHEGSVASYFVPRSAAGCCMAISPGQMTRSTRPAGFFGAREVHRSAGSVRRVPASITLMPRTDSSRSSKRRVDAV